MEEILDTPVDSLFEDILGPEYWVSNSGVSRRSWEILLLRKAMLDDHLWSLAECAERYGISRERVRQLEEDAVAKLVAWKKAEDEKRREHRLRLMESTGGLQRAVGVASQAVSQKFRVPQECREMLPEPADLCCDEALPSMELDALESRVTRRRWTFGELREELLRRL